MRIASTTLQLGGQVQFGDFNVITGGNGVGKTTFLEELFDRACQISRSRYYWIGQPTIEISDRADDLKLLRSSLSRRWEASSYFFFSSATKNHDGQVALDNDLRFSNDEAAAEIAKLPEGFFASKKFVRPFVTYLGCDARLGLPNEVALARLDQPPQDPINVLSRNRQLLAAIDETIFQRLQVHFVLLDHIRTQLLLGTSKEPSPSFDVQAPNQQDEYERIEIWRAEHLVPILEAGHGIRSMIRLLTGIHEPVNKVILIDEPEMHLAASQKRWLGKALVGLAAGQRKQVFLVTHDPLVLQGVLDANAATTVFRLDRDADGKGSVRSCEMTPLLDVTANKKQDQFLQGLFYQRCVVVEGATDRSFYQDLVDRCPEAADRDIGFVACSGKGGTKNMASLASQVGLRTAFIYDLDAFVEQNLLSDVFKMQGGDGDPFSAFEAAVASHIEPKLNGNERSKALKHLLGYTEKEGFTGEWATANRKTIDEALDQLAGRGVFLVPRGTLESWAPAVEPKVRFAELAPPVVVADEALRVPVDTFLRRVLAYLGVSTKTVIPQTEAA